jgi:hypothetical protein
MAMLRVPLAGLAFFFLLAGPARAQRPLSVAEEVEWQPFRTHCLRLLQGLDALQAPLPPDQVRALRALLAKEPADAGAASAAVQKLLDAHCLLGVTINAESRVKAARGPQAAELRCGRETVVLVKVANEAGVTHALEVSGPQLLARGREGPGRWLEARWATRPPFRARLGGGRLEYRALRLRPREAGKREATFQFDVGQGTQDLGFRAEVPVLFTVRNE